MSDVFGYAGIIGLVILVVLFFLFIPVRLWITALASGVRVGLINLVGMRLRKVPPALIVSTLINARKAGLEIDTDVLETHYLAGGNLTQVIDALIAGGKAGIELDFKLATAIDLAGRNVLEAVQTSVNPKIIDCPMNGMISAVAKDGIQLNTRARVTVRANIARLVGGATEETIIARVGEGIVSAIGSVESYKKVLENPYEISRTVLKRGLDSGTAFEILSIDIADINVSKNIGAILQADQAEADLKVAQAKAETRRAMAIAQEQEMMARTQKMNARVVEAEAGIPIAISTAFRDGTLGIFDYYNLRNIQADTSMRDSITKESGEEPE